MLFATPGMLHGGTSLEVFKAWAPDPKNLVLLPSYQVCLKPALPACVHRSPLMQFTMSTATHACLSLLNRVQVAKLSKVDELSSSNYEHA